MTNPIDEPSTPVGERHGAGTYQMLWDCRFCGTTKLLGVTHRHCPNCGAAQDPAWRYFPAEQDMVALEEHVYVGADKVCPACSQPNSASAKFCVQCGADLETGKVVETQGVRDIGTGTAESNTRHDVVKERFDAEMQRIGADQAALKTFLGLRKKDWIIVGVVALVMACIVGAVYAITYRKSASGQVSALKWEREIEIEDFRPRTDGDWDESVPADAYNRHCYEKQRGSRQVESGSHEECHDVDQGDGSFRRECHTVKEYRSEPVYDTWCDYTVDRWWYARTVKASGSETDPPVWPTYTLATGAGLYGKEREGSRHETYTVIVREDDGDSHSCDFKDQAKWASYPVGTKVSLKLYITGKPDCDTLKKAG